jgi:hypothetical protein
MRKALPVISEDAETLKSRLQRERDGRKRPRLHMLYWLASGQAQTRWDVAQLLGVHRNTMIRWCTSSANVKTGSIGGISRPWPG